MDLTPAVYRALGRANLLATHRPDWSASTRLLRSLLQEEGGVALHLLKESGLQLTEYLEKFPWPAGMDEPPIPANRNQEADARKDWGRLLRHARALTRELGEPGEIASHHLIASLLLEEPSPEHHTQVLSDLGLNLERLSSSLLPVSKRVVQMDEPLFDDPPTRCHFPVTGNHSEGGAGNGNGNALARLIDACANRAREGLRVVEDHVRFSLNSLALTTWLKEIRHGLRQALACLPEKLHQAGLDSRDVDGDVGTGISTPMEMTRSSFSDVALANMKRVQESLRSLEEYCKIISSQAATRLESLRYQSYRVEKLLVSLCRPHARLLEARLYLLVGANDCALGLERTTRSALEGGVDMIQSREKGLADKEWLHRLELLRKWTGEAGALLLVNDRPDLALLSGADGVHTGQEDLPVNACQRIVNADGTRRLVGASTHSPEQLFLAVREGADHAGVGPIFPSGTKHFDSFPGLDLVRAVKPMQDIPWFALGGISPGNLDQVLEAGARRVAVSRCVLASDDPGGVCRTLKNRLESFSP